MSAKVRIAFCLPGLHRVVRGAEVAFESIAAALARRGDFDVTLFGSGQARAGDPYRFVHAACVPRERFEGYPRMPILRTEGHWEELTFLPGFLRRFRPSDFDAVVTCSYPLQSWAVRARRGVSGRPLHVFVTQNGDWPLHQKNSEYLLFDCDALVCTNPDYFDEHGKTWPSALIPNGADCALFSPGAPERARFGLGAEEQVVLMVSALIPSKRVLDGIRAVARVPDASLVVAGDGPERDEVESLGRELLGARFRRMRVPRESMPALYRSANAFLHMSMDEPFGNVYVEALATGLPIVAHERRVTRWTLGEHATFVDTEDLAATARGIGAALRDTGDAERRAAVAKARFDWSSVGDSYATFIRGALAEQAGPSDEERQVPRPPLTRPGTQGKEPREGAAPSARGRVAVPASDKVRIAFCLPGLHRVVRGAEVAFESIAAALARRGDFDVTLFGSGQARPDDPYHFVHASCIPRERFERYPSLPTLRTDGHWEELTFLPGFLRRFRPSDFDAVVTCSYPLACWAVRARRGVSGRPLHVFVTQNGDWPLYKKNSEYALFDCDALVCTNPDYFDAHGDKWRSALIPNGVDGSLFYPGPPDRARFGLRADERVVLMVSALIPSKRVLEGVRAVAAVPGTSLLVAGDGPLRSEVEGLGRELLGERFRRVRVARSEMPLLYRSVNAFLHMSIDEPSANAYCEALASGLPIVTHDRRVTRWTLGEHATFVDCLNIQATAEGLRAALGDTRGPERRAAYAKERFDWSSVGDAYAAFLRGAVFPG